MASLTLSKAASAGPGPGPRAFEGQGPAEHGAGVPAEVRHELARITLAVGLLSQPQYREFQRDQ
jgi:hypothetical protein